MLKGSVIIVHKLIVVVGVDKVGVFFGKYISRAHVDTWQLGVYRIFDDKDVFVNIIQIFPLLITKIGVGVAVTNDFTWFFYFYRAVIGGENDPNLLLRKPFQYIK